MSQSPETVNQTMVEPGYGSEWLHLGQSTRDIVSLLGHPESKAKRYRGHYFYNYPKKGLQLDFGTPKGRLKYIFFFRGGVRSNCQAEVLIAPGIKPGDARDLVVETFGEPDEKGESLDLISGIHFGYWFRYCRGMNLEFGSDDRIDMITIAAPKNL